MSAQSMFFTLGLFLLLQSCSVVEENGGVVLVHATESGIFITNDTEGTIYYTAFEQESLTGTSWLPCDDPEQCTGRKPGHFALIEYDEIVGFKPGAEVVVYWWNLHKLPHKDEYKVVNFSWERVKPVVKT